MADKKANVDWMLKFLDAVWGGKTLVFFTKDYIYALTKPDPNKPEWKQVSFTIPDASLEVKDLNSDQAVLLLIEEIQQGLPAYCTDLPLVQDINAVKKALMDL